MLQPPRFAPLALLRRCYSASAQLEDAYRETMSSVASQVMILTTSNTNHKELKGVTLSSVSSLSIRPKCLIQFNLMTPSLTSDLIHSHQRFALHVLSPTKESGELARLFSRNRIFNDKTQQLQPFFPFRELKDDQYEMHEGDELPLLTRNVERILICEKNEMFRVQDHEIWIGEVVDIIDRVEGRKTGGLLNFNRSFHRVKTEAL